GFPSNRCRRSFSSSLSGLPTMTRFPAQLRCVAATRALFGGAGLFAALGMALAAAFATMPAHAIAPELIHDLALGENAEKVKAIGALVASGDPQALPLLQSLLAGEVQTVDEKIVLRVKDNAATDLSTGAKVEPLPESRDDVVLNNRVRRELATGIAALQLEA